MLTRCYMYCIPHDRFNVELDGKYAEYGRSALYLEPGPAFRVFSSISCRPSSTKVLCSCFLLNLLRLLITILYSRQETEKSTVESTPDITGENQIRSSSVYENIGSMAAPETRCHSSDTFKIGRTRMDKIFHAGDSVIHGEDLRHEGKDVQETVPDFGGCSAHELQHQQLQFRSVGLQTSFSHEESSSGHQGRVVSELTQTAEQADCSVPPEKRNVQPLPPRQASRLWYQERTTSLTEHAARWADQSDGQRPRRTTRHPFYDGLVRSRHNSETTEGREEVEAVQRAVCVYWDRVKLRRNPLVNPEVSLADMCVLFYDRELFRQDEKNLQKNLVFTLKSAVTTVPLVKCQ